VRLEVRNYPARLRISTRVTSDTRSPTSTLNMATTRDLASVAEATEYRSATEGSRPVRRLRHAESAPEPVETRARAWTERCRAAGRSTRTSERLSGISLTKVWLADLGLTGLGLAGLGGFPLANSGGFSLVAAALVRAARRRGGSGAGADRTIRRCSGSQKRSVVYSVGRRSQTPAEALFARAPSVKASGVKSWKDRVSLATAAISLLGCLSVGARRHSARASTGFVSLLLCQLPTSGEASRILTPSVSEVDLRRPGSLTLAVTFVSRTLSRTCLLGVH
jgi:hypothetical protein